MSHPVVGRFAPSPTGPLHFGSLVAALGSWLSARSQGGRWHLRIEDIDPPREQPGAAQDILDSLQGFGFDHDGPVLWQSTRVEAYAVALQTLIDAGHAYPCICTRSDLAASAGRHGATCIRPWRHNQAHAWRL
ncbi:MAG TPA: tRNA glutamyl-Q(34) synthetase GluQRS, partial [Mizugakiibacter sp.]|nr:tRNA glutamyl-Q(34) synthetase GluQRS [Mizugakiibacter sp.]